MARGSERQRFAIQFYRFLQILKTPCLLETRLQSSCEVAERVRAIRMTRGSESERFAILMNDFINIMRRRSLTNVQVTSHPRRQERCVFH